MRNAGFDDVFGVAASSFTPSAIMSKAAIL
jgi:hypothetical protein